LVVGTSNCRGFTLFNLHVSHRACVRTDDITDLFHRKVEDTAYIRNGERMYKKQDKTSARGQEQGGRIGEGDKEEREGTSKGQGESERGKRKRESGRGRGKWKWKGEGVRVRIMGKHGKGQGQGE
jgi:hypothetical protein